MLQSMRNNMKGTIAFIIVGFLAFIMAASLVNLTGNQNASSYGDVAEVNGRVISERDLQIGISQERRRLQSQFGDNLPADFLSDDRLRPQVLQSLIVSKVLIDKAYSDGMTVSDSELDKLIVEAPEFQRDGVFDSQLFLQNVRNFGHSPVTYRNLLKDGIVVENLRSGLLSSSFVTPREIEQTVALSRQERDFSWISFPLGDMPEKMQVSDSEIEEYYQENQADYLTEEQVSIEYIQLDVNDFTTDIEVAEEDVRQQYDTELQQLKRSNEREAAHILIEGNDEAAQQKITAVQEKLANGEDFAALASSYSDDFGSKDNGGFLGVTTGGVFPEAFEDVLASLNVGEVSEPVEIDGATHIIKLVSSKESAAPSFEESRARIESELKTLQAEEIFLEKLNALKDIAYNADTLSEVAEQLDLTVGNTGLFSRALPAADPVLNDRRVVDAAFSDQVLNQGFTSEVLELTPQRAVVVNLLEHQPVRTLTLDEKRDDIVTELKISKAEAELKTRLDVYIEELNAGKTLATLAEENELIINTQNGAQRDTGSLDSELRSHVFAQARPVDGSVISSTTMSNGDLALVVLDKVTDADFASFTEEEQRSIRLSLSRGASISEYRAWESGLVNDADVDYKSTVSY